MSKPEADRFDYWSERDLLVMQRRCLLNERHEIFQQKTPQPKAAARSAQMSLAAPIRAPGLPAPPPLLYSFDTVYRFTRGVNDLSNTGLGYGELNREARLVPNENSTLTPEYWWLRRTRTGWQRLRLGPPEMVTLPPPSGDGGPPPTTLPPSTPPKIPEYR
jgi:hypothetical protein